MIRDYFADLELGPDADLEDVKRAYRRLARRFHPDLNPGDLYAEESFKRIREAFDHLNSQSRILKVRKSLSIEQKLSQSYSRWKREPQIGAYAVHRFVDQWKIQGSTRPEESLDIHVMLNLDLSQRTQALELVTEEVCSSCRGKGGTSRSIQQTCKNCAGLGYQLIRRGAFRWKKTCDNCRGMGVEILSACSSCQGYGKVSKRQTVHIPTPKDWDGKSPSVFKGLGNQSFDGKTRGDLWVNWIKKK